MTKLLIAYDGSPSAATAVRVAAGLFRDAHVSVVTVPNEPTVHVGTAGAALPGAVPFTDRRVINDLVAEARREAAETSEQAAQEARTLGLDAEPVTVPASI